MKVYFQPSEQDLEKSDMQPNEVYKDVKLAKRLHPTVQTWIVVFSDNPEELKILDDFDRGKEVEFVCPDCGDTRLECVEDGPYVSEVTFIDSDGDFDYGSINAGGEVVCFQCVNCGYVLWNKYEITNTEEVVEWCLKNCPQGD